MKSVFISHARTDKRIAETLRRSLRETQSLAWSDRGRASPVDTVADDVRRSFKKANALIIILSEHSTDSPWVQFGLGAAIGLDKPVIAVVVGRGEVATPDWLKGVKVIDGRKRAMAEIADAVSDALSAEGVR